MTCCRYFVCIFLFLPFLGIFYELSAVASLSAERCTDAIRNSACALPTCRCCGSDIPGNISRSQTPQFVFLTFDDSISLGNFRFYQEINSKKFKNPNGHPITLTFFVSHEYTNYELVHNLWQKGHEIALHSISHKSNTGYWKDLSYSGWTKEVAEQRVQISHFANIPPSDVRGMRSPFLQGGGDIMYKALRDHSLNWECSRPSVNLVWPYTNDYAGCLKECSVPPCPSEAHPGFWTVPMIELESSQGDRCSMVDACTPLPKTANKTFELLKTNFERHYQGNKAPFGIYAHSGWLYGTDSKEVRERGLGYLKFVEWLNNLEDVYIVSISKALEWMRKPVLLGNMGELQEDVRPEGRCGVAKSCGYKVQESWGSSER